MRRALVGLVLVANAAACGGGSGSKAAVLPTLSPAAPASPASIATPSAPTRVTAADIEAAARRFYAVLNGALRTSNASLLATVADVSCPCYQRLAPKMNLRQARGEISTASAVILRVFDAKIDSSDTGRVSVIFEEAPAAIMDAKGNVVEPTGGTKARQEVLKIRKIAGHLRVIDVIDFGLVS